ncbi:hypothetical protein VARIO8X_90520 [Burkholderiales bacterium 8X]|nr:hypothetical protein VARIO8X_90520 [Burkholderiales bacterium 8X]
MFTPPFQGKVLLHTLLDYIPNH